MALGKRLGSLIFGVELDLEQVTVPVQKAQSKIKKFSKSVKEELKKVGLAWDANKKKILSAAKAVKNAASIVARSVRNQAKNIKKFGAFAKKQLKGVGKAWDENRGKILAGAAAIGVAVIAFAKFEDKFTNLVTLLVESSKQEHLQITLRT